MDYKSTFLKEKVFQIDSWISELNMIRIRLEKSGDEVKPLFAQIDSLHQQLGDLKNIFSDAHSFNEAGIGRLRDITEKNWGSIEENVQKSLAVFEGHCTPHK